jgi:lipoprotein-anchoring transpeptidase ErfK/SrfK
MTQRAPTQPVLTQRSFVIPAVIVGVLIVLAVGAYAYDSSREDLIAKGVTVAGVDVGGMRADKARATLSTELAHQLQRPVEVSFGKKHYELSPRAVGLKPEVNRMVDAAVAKSRGGNIFSRVARDITGGEEKADLEASVAYSRPAVNRFVKRVEQKVNQPVHDATLDFPSLKQVKERNGVKVIDASFRERLGQALRVPSIDQVKIPADITRPKVTRAQLAAKYPTVIVIERSAFRLTLYKHLHPVHIYTIAVGRQGLETPAGLYTVQDKQVDPSWHVPNSSWAGSLAGQVIPPGPDDPLKARWIGITGGAGIHGTDEVGSLGSAASHGCIRMAIPDVIALYDRVPYGSKIYVA